MKQFVRCCQLIAMLCFVMFVGCSSLSDVLKTKSEGGGTTKIYAVNQDQAWEIAKTVFRWEGTDSIEEHKDEGYMLTSTGAGMLTMGTVMGAWVERVADKETKVTVITKRRVATNFATDLTESTFHKRFTQGVDIVSKGNRLPMTKPD